MRRPPKWIDKLLDWYCDPMFSQEIKGDLHELHTKWSEKKGPVITRIYYLFNALLFLRLYNSKFKLSEMNSPFNASMIYFLKLSFRALLRHRVFNAVNIGGLAVCVAAGLVIFFHIQEELRFDTSFSNHDRIYRISTNQNWAKSCPSLGPELSQYFPELEEVGRFARYGGNVSIISNNDLQVSSSEIFQVDPSVLKIFDFDVLTGKSEGVLDRPYTVLLTMSMAQKLFGDSSPVGEKIRINGKQSFEVTGVIDDLPTDSHIRADLLISMATFYETIPLNWLENKGWMVTYTYALLNRSTNFEAFASKMPLFEKHFIPENSWRDRGDNFFEIMPLTDIHLRSDRVQEMRENSRMIYVYIFGSLAAIILMIASVNFVNISTAIGLKRSKEMGVRSVMGADRSSLIYQLLTDAVVSSFLACALGALLFVLVLPYYNTIANTHLLFTDILTLSNTVYLILFAAVLGIVSGLYPAFFVTKKLSVQDDVKGPLSVVRRILIIGQLALSLFIMISALSIHSQINFINEMELGFDKQQIITIKTYGAFRDRLDQNQKATKSKLLGVPGISKFGRVSTLVGDPLSQESFVLSNSPPETQLDNSVNMLWADEGFINTLNIELVRGRNFSPSQDTAVTFLINESLAKQLGGDVVGQMADWRGDNRGEIVGIVKDFHHYSLHSEIGPIVITYKPDWAEHILLKAASSNMSEIILTLDNTVNEMVPETMLLYGFVDDKLNALYGAENTILDVILTFSALAWIISCVGLLGIAGLEVQRRTKEIGIRKVLGANGGQVIQIISKPFTRMVIFAILIGLPTSYLLVEEWLASFSYRLNLSLDVFLIPCIMLALLTSFIVVFHSLRTIKANPAKVLKYE